MIVSLLSSKLDGSGCHKRRAVNCGVLVARKTKYYNENERTSVTLVLVTTNSVSTAGANSNNELCRPPLLRALPPRSCTVYDRYCCRGVLQGRVAAVLRRMVCVSLLLYEVYHMIRYPYHIQYEDGWIHSLTCFPMIVFHHDERGWS